MLPIDELEGALRFRLAESDGILAVDRFQEAEDALAVVPGAVAHDLRGRLRPPGPGRGRLPEGFGADLLPGHEGDRRDPEQQPRLHPQPLGRLPRDFANLVGERGRLRARGRRVVGDRALDFGPVAVPVEELGRGVGLLGEAVLALEEQLASRARRIRGVASARCSLSGKKANQTRVAARSTG